MEVLLDGESLSEAQVYAQGLMAEGLPVLAVSGDRWLLEELDDGELGGARLLQTKEGQGRARAASRGVEEARTELSDAIAAALADPPAPPPARPYPTQLRITAEGEEIANVTVSEPPGLLTAVATAFRTSDVSREYRQLATLFPSGHDSWVRNARRHLGSLISRPVMRSKERRWLASAP
jgi:D-aminopeptidase